VEAAIAEHPAVADVAVIGVPNEKWGEVGHAYVVTRTGRRCEPNEIVAFTRERLAGYKVPKVLVIVEALPRLGSGKVDRNALARASSGVPLSPGDRDGTSRAPESAGTPLDSSGNAP
jgi:fatty-acyl-CoA synthase